MQEIQEFENFFHRLQYKSLLGLLKSHKLGWRFMDTPSLEKDAYISYYKDSNVVKDSPAFGHFFYRYELPLQSYDFDVYGLFYNKLKAIYSSDIKIFRIRANMTLPYPNYIHSYNAPHIDWEFEHDTLIYYLNSSDGDTVLFEETYPEFKENDVTKVYKRITPKENKAIIFRGNRYHAASPSLTNVRYIINVNFKCQ